MKSKTKPKTVKSTTAAREEKYAFFLGADKPTRAYLVFLAVLASMGTITMPLFINATFYSLSANHIDLALIYSFHSVMVILMAFIWLVFRKNLLKRRGADQHFIALTNRHFIYHPDSSPGNTIKIPLPDLIGIETFNITLFESGADYLQVRYLDQNQYEKQLDIELGYFSATPKAAQLVKAAVATLRKS